ncbi:single-stranded DNA-binding protein [Candidatus Sororendozoicomonas aggregata]|uniref:single-stranded DNA-binding protein n=1 Tax=Candidatus Sororendozoicomonas aggregata TaxID=3073239 RepID=UPI002ED530EC
MRGINKAIIVGTLGGDPDVRYTPDGKCISTVSMATNEKWKDKQGQPKEKTEWHRVTLFGKLGELARDYLRKGSKAYVEGKLTTQKWQDDHGSTHYTTQISVNEIGGVLQLLDPPPANNHQPAAQPAQSAQSAQKSHRQQPAHTQNSYQAQSQGTQRQPAQQQPQQQKQQQGFDDVNDEIPF